MTEEDDDEEENKTNVRTKERHCAPREIWRRSKASHTTRLTTTRNVILYTLCAQRATRRWDDGERVRVRARATEHTIDRTHTHSTYAET